MRGSNNILRSANKPLPLIEDFSVNQGVKHTLAVLDPKLTFHQQPFELAGRPITTRWTRWDYFSGNVQGLRPHDDDDAKIKMEKICVPMSRNRDRIPWKFRARAKPLEGQFHSIPCIGPNV